VFVKGSFDARFASRLLGSLGSDRVLRGDAGGGGGLAGFAVRGCLCGRRQEKR
jgi:hypothetical protein